jgi:A/G-specific adenine glycosylase
VASLAFHQPVAALDGNVKRVLGRLFPEFHDPRRSPAPKNLEEFLEGWIPIGRASDFNQALMDLGAAICIPSRPKCSACPVLTFCPTKGELSDKKPTVRKIRRETWAIALVERDGRYLLHRNEAQGLLAGLWQFPKVVLDKGRGKDTAPKDPGKWLKKYLRQDFGLRVKIISHLPEQEYFFTHIHARMKPYSCILIDPVNSPQPRKSACWVKPSGFFRYPISTAMRKIAAMLDP